MFNYYINSRNVFVIIKAVDRDIKAGKDGKEKGKVEKDREYTVGKVEVYGGSRILNANINFSALANKSLYDGSLLNSKLNLSSIMNEDDSMGDRNDSIL